ncbi:hypothetical protein KUW19_00070 [Ferrimonas balearica]|uniref:hypothetical protein n=1 Tax=Ferrimonas balearica TaxID=44012 RepID=UPI001C974232|nr:hypothetical protein [Ferrimonas balearica]MBY6104876.1 hypothetical protein [Ferrimonas balearica]
MNLEPIHAKVLAFLEPHKSAGTSLTQVRLAGVFDSKVQAMQVSKRMLSMGLIIKNSNNYLRISPSGSEHLATYRKSRPASLAEIKTERTTPAPKQAAQRPVSKSAPPNVPEREKKLAPESIRDQVLESHPGPAPTAAQAKPIAVPSDRVIKEDEGQTPSVLEELASWAGEVKEITQLKLLRRPKVKAAIIGELSKLPGLPESVCRELGELVEHLEAV